MKRIDILTEPTDSLGRLLSARRTGLRKFRLFTVACCRADFDLITDPNCRELMDLAEQFADGEVPAVAVAELRRKVHRWAAQQPHITLEPTNELDPDPDGHKRWMRIWAAYQTAKPTGRPVFGFTNHFPYRPLLADIVGPSPMFAIFSPEWRTDTAVSLARGMYDSRDFSAMPILADALQDAGCDSADILNHCRDAKQVHIRGCWVVDLVLGKE